MARQSVTERHGELVGYALERYQAKVSEMMSYLAEGGELPGLEKVKPSEVRSFFEERDAMQWTALAQTDPEAALRDLRDWAEVET